MENLKALVKGIRLNAYQRMLAQKEFEAILQEFEKLEKKVKLVQCPTCGETIAV